MISASELAAKLGGKANGSGFVAKCPAHDDKTPSLSIRETNGTTLVHCHAGCSQDAVLTALTDRGLDVRSAPEVEHVSVAAFAERKGLDAAFLKQNSVRDLALDRGASAIGFEYRDLNGALTGTKVRRSITNTERGFFWSKDSKPSLYGLWRIADMTTANKRLLIVEGESDCLTLWQHGIPALGLPGASSWRDSWAADFPSGAQVFAVIEPDAGGEAFLKSLDKSTIRDRVRIVTMPVETKDPSALYLSDRANFVSRMDAMLAAAVPLNAAPPSDNPALTLRPIGDIVAERREPQWLLPTIVEKHVLAVLAGHRGSFKSFIALDWMMRTALGGHGVVILSGEGGGLDRRVAAWMQIHAPEADLAALRVVAYERPLNLTSGVTMDLLVEAIRALPWRADCILIDTLSKFSPGLDENSNAEMAEFLGGLAVRLRDDFEVSVLLVAHSGHGDSKRPRGASALMANPDAEFIVERPDPVAMTCTVTRDRFKDTAALPPLAYVAEAVDLGRVDSLGDPVTSLVMRLQGEAVRQAKAPRGKNQSAALTALREWARANPAADMVSSMDIRDLLTAQGVGRQRRPEVLESLVAIRVLTPSIGGYTFDRSML